VQKKEAAATRGKRASSPGEAVQLGEGIVDVFCGIGGLSLGFKKVGFKITAGIDIDDNARYAYERYTGGRFIKADVAKLESGLVKTLLGTVGPRILIGCAPCQSFSEYNKKGRGSAWNLLPAFARLVEDADPDIVSMENVARLADHNDGRTLRTFVDRLSRAGYNVSWYIVSSADYGISQRRKRLILFGSKYGFVDLIEATHNKEVTLRQAIGDLPVLRAGGANKKDRYHRAQGLSDVNAQRMKHTTPGGSWRQWPKRLRVACHKTAAGAEFGSVYGRLSWKAIGPTITTQFFKIGTGRFGHPSQLRGLSLREGAILQTFPRNFQFAPPNEEIAFDVIGRLIGNAVPVRLGEIVARSIKRHIEDHYGHARLRTEASGVGIHPKP
jgi:DNA (cytosine-5)-methyltransferase 1